MLKEKKNYTVTAYEAGTKTVDGKKSKWIVEVTETETMFEAWLYLDKYGVNYMFGSPKWQEYRQATVTEEDFLGMVEALLKGCKVFYEKEYIC